MVASNKTAEKIAESLRRHLTAPQIINLLDDLQGVEGNTSFKETIKRVRGLLLYQRCNSRAGLSDIYAFVCTRPKGHEGSHRMAMDDLEGKIVV